jgi:hypothetical protein
MDAPLEKVSKPEHTKKRQRMRQFEKSRYDIVEINMSQGLVNLTFAYLSILTGNI